MTTICSFILLSLFYGCSTESSQPKTTLENAQKTPIPSSNNEAQNEVKKQVEAMGATGEDAHILEEMIEATEEDRDVDSVKKQVEAMGATGEDAHILEEMIEATEEDAEEMKRKSIKKQVEAMGATGEDAHILEEMIESME